MEAVYSVYKQMLSPFILFVARYSKEVYKEPKEQFVIKCGRNYKLRPLFEVSSEPELQTVKSGDLETTALLYTTKVLFKQGQVMVVGKGNSKRQSERNAGVQGLRYLEEHPELKCDDSI